MRQVLADGPTPSNTVKADAASAGVSWASVRRAAEALRVVKTKGIGGAWYWKLPTPRPQGAQHAQHSNVEQVEQHDPVAARPPLNGATGAEDAEVF
ncbi:hypothetical protein D3C85_1536160 [compost metagenome]